MKDRGPWRLWSPLLLLLAGNLCVPSVLSQSYDGARGDAGDGRPAALGFDDVLRRHDGYVKGETPTIPQTSFTCSAQPYNPGLYADVETQCQVYHVCFEDRQESFLCGPGTNFNQRILACDFWYNFECQDSPKFYSTNADIGKVPDKLPETVFKPVQGGQGSRTPQQPRPQPQQPRPQPQQPRPQPQPQPQQPSYPGFPQPGQPPSGGSFPDRVRVPSPPSRPYQPQEPVQPQQPIQPQQPYQPPRIQPQQPVQPQLPRQPFKPQPQQPIQPHPQEPIRPQPPSFQPQEPVQPQQPSFPSPPPFRPAQPQPPTIHERPAPHPQPPVFQPQPRPEFPRESFKPQYPGVPGGSGQQGNRRPYQPPTQQEEHDGYQFDGHKPPKRVVLPPPQPAHPQTPRPVFPPVISPPRVSRPPLTPPFNRQPEISRPRVPAIDTTRRSEYHPNSDLKGNTIYRPPQQHRDPLPSRPVGSEYPNYPVPQRPVSRPIEKPSRPAYQPPPNIQQEHVETEYVPPPPPPPPKEPSRPQTTYIPPPHVRQEVVHPKPPQQPSRPAYVPPPAVQKPVETEFLRPQPPVSPSVIREEKKPASPPPSGPRGSAGSRRPERPNSVFPPAIDHPNANIKGGPGYHQPPPQIPRFEPTRIGRPSNPQGSTATAIKPAVAKTPSASGQGSYKPPEQGRIKKPSEPPRSVYQPPIQVIDHPQAEIKGVGYQPPIRQEPQRIQSPSTSISGVKRPQGNAGHHQPQVERPRAPIVVSRPQPPSLPTSSIKKISPVDNQVYEKPKPQPPAPIRVKQPSTPIQTVSRPSQPRFPIHEVIDHPNANVKGGYQQPQIQVLRPSGPPPSSSINQGRVSGSGYPSPPHGDYGEIHQPDYKPSRSSPPSSIKTANKVSHTTSAVKDTSRYERPLSGSQHSVLINKQSKPDYEAGSSYTRGPEVYPKPEFGKPNTPVSTPSRQVVKQGSPSQNTITRSQNKPTSQGSSLTAGSGSGGSDIRPSSFDRPNYPFNQVPGHQPPHERQVFPHRENPDHPNESLKGSAAYRPPPPAGFQAAASEIQEQQVDLEVSSDSKLGDTGSE